MARLTLSDIRARSTGYFFSRDTMRYYRGSKYSTRYDRETDTNYVVVDTPRAHPFNGKRIWYRFIEATGDLRYVNPEEVSQSLRVRGRPEYAKRSRTRKSSKKTTPANFGGINLKRVF